jgi:hypothetical protein
MKGICKCWSDYPNEALKHKSGKWICVDKYECVSERHKDKRGLMVKTVCRKKSLGEVGEQDE